MPLSDSSPLTTDKASLFDALPWPAAAVSDAGLILAVNPGFRVQFPLTIPGSTTLDELFETPVEGTSANDAIIGLNAGSTGRTIFKSKPGALNPKYRLHVKTDTADTNRRWVFLPDNIAAEGRPLLTPRSELELTRMVLDHTPDFLFLRDPDGSIIFASRALNRFLKSPADGYEIGRTLGSFLTEECTADVVKLDRDTLESGSTVHRPRMRFTAANGDSKLLDLTQEPVSNAAGNLVGLLTFGRDITARVDRENKLNLALEEARNAGETRNAFVANVSHEIRTPINGILGMAELCLDSQLGADQRKYIQSVLDCGRTLLTLVNDILDFSKVESGRITFENIEFDFARLLADTASKFSSSAFSRHVEVIVDSDPNLPLRVKGDPIRIKQVIDNLVSNALKFTRRGHVILRAHSDGIKDGKLRLAVDIADTGIGIALDQQERIFEAFTQADASTTRKFGGTGLGLSICKRLLEMMDGKIAVQSTPGVGSVFSVEIPVDEVDGQTISHGEPLRNVRVGIVSDDELRRAALRRTFEGLGAHIQESPATVDAFRMFMPGTNGAGPVQLFIADFPAIGVGSHGLADMLVGRCAISRTPIITLAAPKNEPASLSRLRSTPHVHLTKPAGHHELRAAALALLDLEDSELSKTKSAADAPMRRLRVLLAEDNPVNQELALRRLEKLGHQVDLAEDGGKAWDLFVAKRHDIALLDVQMPVLDGLRLAQRIRENEAAGTARIPLVALTALAMESDRRECIEAGFDTLLTKPFLSDDLRRVIDNLVPYPESVDSLLPSPAHPAEETRRIMVSPNVTRAPSLERRSHFDFEAALKGLGEEEAEDLRFAGEVFLTYWVKETAALHDAWEKKNMRGLALIAHRIQGGASALKGKAVSELAEKLEAAAGGVDSVQDIGVILRKLVDELQVMAEGIREHLEASQPRA